MKKIFLFTLLLTCVVLFPLIRHPATQIPDNSDGLLGAYTLARVQENILQGKDVFYGNTFYPHTQTLLFSDIFVTSAVISLPLRVVTQEPLTFYSFSLVSAFFLTILASFAFFDELLFLQGKRNRWLAYLFAVIFTLSQVHMRYIAHLHMFALQYVLLSLWSILKFLTTKEKKWLFLATLGCILQVWQSLFLTYYVFLFGLGLCLFPQNRKVFVSAIKTIILCCVIFVFFCLPVVLGYVHFSQTYHVVRDIREVIHFSLVFPDLWQQFFSPVAYATLLLGGLAYIYHKRYSYWSSMLLGFGLFSFVLSLGPAFHWGSDTIKPIVFGHVFHIPLPYAVFYYLAPGFKAFRTPSRFMPLTLLLLLGWSMLELSKRKIISTYRIPLTILGCGVSLVLALPLHVVTIPSVKEYPPHVLFLATRAEHVLIKLPIRNWADPKANEDTYEMLYSLYHQKVLINGQSGFFPEEWMSFQHQIQMTFPSQEATRLMKARGIEIIEIDMHEYNRKDVMKFVTPVFESRGWMIALLQ